MIKLHVLTFKEKKKWRLDYGEQKQQFSQQSVK